MPSYPIEVERRHFRGSDHRKRVKAEEFNRDAAILEEYVNAQILKTKETRFLFSQIARATGFSRERVREILYSVGCSDNGFTLDDLPDSFPK